MDKLLQPNTGLMVWTIITFLCLVVVLTKAAWKPILESLEKREGKIKGDLDQADKLRREAEEFKAQFESRLTEAQKTIQNMMAEAKASGETVRQQMLGSAREESQKIVEKGRKDLIQETEKLKDVLRNEVAGLAVNVAERVLQKNLNPNLQEQILKDSIQEVSGMKS